MSEVAWAIPIIFFTCSMVLWCICCCVSAGCKPPIPDAPTRNAIPPNVILISRVPVLPNDEDPV